MELRAGYKKTEVGVIPVDWEVKTLKEISTLITKGTTPQRFTDTGVTYVKIESLAGNEINTEKCLFIDDVTHKTDLKRSILKEGDLLFAIAGATIGKCTIVPKEIIPANTNQALAIIRLKEEENKMYVFYFLKSTLMQKYIIDNIAGGAQPNLNLAQVGGYFFPLPPSKTEQTAIATALSDADALISGLEKLIAKKRNIKQGAMQKLLQPKEGWEVKKLGEVCDVRDGTHDSPRYFDNGVMFVTSKNIIDGKLDFSEISFISNEDAIQVNQRSKVDKGDILMSMIGTIGNAVLVDLEPDFCIKNVALLKPKKINPIYLLQLIYSSSFQKYIESKLDGGIQKFISLGVLRDLDIPFPQPEEQTRIATILSDMDAEITAIETKFEKYRKVKLGMMQNLLTGKIRLV